MVLVCKVYLRFTLLRRSAALARPTVTAVYPTHRVGLAYQAAGLLAFCCTVSQTTLTGYNTAV